MSRYEKENADNTLADFLDSIALVSDVDSLEEGAEAVTLMTMHSAKGLEFNVVFLVGMAVSYTHLTLPTNSLV